MVFEKWFQWTVAYSFWTSSASRRSTGGGGGGGVVKTILVHYPVGFGVADVEEKIFLHSDDFGGGGSDDGLVSAQWIPVAISGNSGVGFSTVEIPLVALSQRLP